MATKERIIIEEMFQIVDKSGKDVPFLLNSTQAELDANLTGRDIVPKARQLGISAYFLARYTAKCLAVKNTRAVVISHDKESTQRMLSRVHYYLRNLRGPSARIRNASKNELTFPKTNSMFYIGTAGSRKFGRGDMITDLHCSEIAYWDDPKSLISGLFQAVPRDVGEIAIESTGNGVGNYYHRTCMRAYEGKSRFRVHFFNWLKAKEYQIPVTEREREEILLNPKIDLEEPELLKQGLTPEQIMFRREKLEELDYDLVLFKQEYPITLDECFQATGYSFFTRLTYQPTDQWVRIDANTWALESVWAHPDHRYAIGVDVGGGVRRDRSVVEVVDLFTNEQVCEWVGDRISPDDLARVVIKLGLHFRDAFVTVETNNHGAVTLLKLIEGFPHDAPKVSGYPTYLLFQNNKPADHLLDYGYKTTSRTKPIVIGNLRKQLGEGFIIHSPTLKDEVNTFIETESGKLEATQGCFDDRVLALAVALEGAKSSVYIHEIPSSQEHVDVMQEIFGLDAMLGELKKKYRMSTGGIAIPAQDIGSYGNFTRH